LWEQEDYLSDGDDPFPQGYIHWDGFDRRCNSGNKRGINPLDPSATDPNTSDDDDCPTINCNTEWNWPLYIRTDNNCEKIRYHQGVYVIQMTYYNCEFPQGTTEGYFLAGDITLLD